MKRSTLWILTGTAAAALIAVGTRWISQRQVPPPAAPAASAATALIELGPSDVITVQKMDMTVGLPLSGTLKASQSAFVKARVVGELMDLVVREGDMVKAGQVIARIDPIEYQARERQAKLQADAAQSQAEIAQKQYDNNKSLVDQGFISQTALQTSLSSLNAAKATAMAALAGLDVARKALDDSIIRAPIGGQISQRLAQPGERMALDGRIVEIVNLAQFEIEAAVAPAEASQIRVGMKAQLQIEGRAEPVQARVLRINPSAQTGSRGVLVYLGLAGADGLRQGLFAEGTLGTRSIQALAVPLSSVRTDKPQPYVQVVDGEKIRHVAVQTGARTEKSIQNNTLTWVEVQGLADGAQVLAGSAGAVREGTQVKPGAGLR
jgi:RND family efflux transporter MFP subunit